MTTYGLTGTVYMHDVLGTGEMVPLGNCASLSEDKVTEETDNESVNRYLSAAPISGSFTLTPTSMKRFDAFIYWVWTGNNLYFHFPKKMKRSRGITRLKNKLKLGKVSKE